MKPILPLLVCLALLGISRADVADIENQFRAAYELQVGAQYAASVADLDAKYIGALERAMQLSTQGGKLEDALSFRDEIQRMKDKAPLPESDDGATPALAKLRGTYREQLSRLRLARQKVVMPMLEKFAAALAGYQEQLTKAGDVQGALAVKTYRESGLAKRLTGDALAVSQPTSTAATEKPFENSLGMRFVPVIITGGPTDRKSMQFSIWETRMKDYRAFASETQREWEQASIPGFEPSDDHPATMVSWEDATAFCEWLTNQERMKRKIGPKDVYRLPTDHEWSCAVGIGADEDPGASPAAKDEKLPVFPWGKEYPPPKGAGNFYGEEYTGKPDPSFPTITGSNDGFTWPAPVGSFFPNGRGIHDLGGNLKEWCQDWYDPAKPSQRVVRGASYVYDNSASKLCSSARMAIAPSNTRAYTGFRVVLEAF